MTDNQSKFPDPTDAERQLWTDSQAGETGRNGPCPELMLLAAFVEGNLDAGERQRIEQHLADCAECVRAVCDARSILTLSHEDFEAVPERGLASARALVAADGVIHVTSPVLARISPRQWMGRAMAAAAACLLVAFLGYRFGAASNDQGQVREASLISELTFGMAGDEAQVAANLEMELWLAIGEASS